MRDIGSTEVGGFGVTAADDLLLVEDVCFPEQLCTPWSVAFCDLAVADFFDEQVDLGRRPEQFARIWVHTHPGCCPLPSGTDEQTFARVFGRSTWALMFILAQGGQTYSRLRFNVGPGGAQETDVEVDYHSPFTGSDTAAWSAEYRTNIRAITDLCAQESIDAWLDNEFVARRRSPCFPGLPLVAP